MLSKAQVHSVMYFGVVTRLQCGKFGLKQTQYTKKDHVYVRFNAVVVTVVLQFL